MYQSFVKKQLINKFPTIIGQRGVNEVAFKHGSMQTNFWGESQNFMIFKQMITQDGLW